jgi:hypothetical protein
MQEFVGRTGNTMEQKVKLLCNIGLPFFTAVTFGH